MAAKTLSHTELRKKSRSKKSKKRQVVDISSSSSSESDNDTSTKRATKFPAKKQMPDSTNEARQQSSETQTQLDRSTTTQPTQSAPPKAQPKSQPPPTTAPSVDEAFTSLYLRKVTAELADDLDKVRAASDFKMGSLPVLIRALSQGVSVYGSEEKRGIVSVAGGTTQ